MTSIACQRHLSAFRPSLRRWAPISPGPLTTHETDGAKAPVPLSLITWNIDGFSARQVARAKLLLGDILDGAKRKRPDVVFLQEVTTSVCSLILDDPTVRDAFLVTDAEDQSSFQGVPFANMTLLSKECFDFSTSAEEAVPQAAAVSAVELGDSLPKFSVGPASRIQLPSKYGRAALCVDICSQEPSPSMYRLINVHLDSLGDELAFQNRSEQLHILGELLRAPGCSGGLIAGDFNAVRPQDHALLEENGLNDVWLHLNPPGSDAQGTTWAGVATKPRRDNNLGFGRLDKVALLGIQPQKMQILRPGVIEVPIPGAASKFIPTSDHCGLYFEGLI